MHSLLCTFSHLETAVTKQPNRLGRLV
uniref:Uncharacterized protein n=1 Tax=Anguilla anguilla TaxID=7936 RepID=A0A0E9WAU6_ANGAN